MGRGTKVGSSDRALQRQVTGHTGHSDAVVENGMADVIKASSGALAALADTLNALTLRIPLAGTAGNCEGKSYGRLAHLAASASEQVRGIQQLLSSMEGAMPHNQSGRTKHARRRH